MNNAVVTLTIRFLVLVLFQVALLNHMTVHILGDTNPYLYILFIIWYPITDSDDRLIFIFLSFLIGLSIDLFSDSGGIHAASSVLIGYLRKPYMRLSFGVGYEQQAQKLSQSSYAQRFIYLSLMIVTHHLTMYSLESFSFASMGYVLQKTLLTSLFTLILVLLTISIFSKKQ
ncbi:rod shape-determining protein MreD [Neptunitalea chrysea]|uniref:Rod shape-determining protein MreD n=1 Tax=Neptunitalea chrysea TaxID=1647581 RepID=A0A9W6B638_9FLAO|nr:rod shape-determining protein MreD [Neptunitalea chrysea]GLB53521.1 rod shape-determining protein MreD [Neptunitalea chrysea]